MNIKNAVLAAVAAGSMMLAACASNTPCCDTGCCAPKCAPCAAPCCKGVSSCKSCNTGGCNGNSCKS